jgi:hypothetical protein
LKVKCYDNGVHLFDITVTEAPQPHNTTFMKNNKNYCVTASQMIDKDTCECMIKEVERLGTVKPEIIQNLPTVDVINELVKMRDSSLPTLDSKINSRITKVFNKSVPEGLTSAKVPFAEAQPDTNYMISATFSWLTAYKITAKTVNDFTVELSQAAPANAKVDYVILR